MSPAGKDQPNNNQKEHQRQSAEHTREVHESERQSAEAARREADEARKAFERDYLVRILKITGGNVTKAARLAGRNRTEFYRLLERHSLEPGMFKGSGHKEKATV